MKIVSKFNDYYDSIQAYGHDDSCMYIRKNEKNVVCNLDYKSLFVHFEKWMELSSGTYWYSRNGIFDITPKFLIFCGELYPFLEISYTIPQYNKASGDNTCTGFAYNREGFDTIMSGYNKHFPKSNAVEELLKPKGRGWALQVDTNTVNEFFNLSNLLRDNVNEIAFNLGVPYFIIDGETEGKYRKNNSITDKNFKLCNFIVDLNPRLSDYKFFTIKDHFTTYTDIRNYIEQQLGGNSPRMDSISNDDMIVKKGFDLKSSFRKSPTKKR